MGLMTSILRWQRNVIFTRSSGSLVSSTGKRQETLRGTAAENVCVGLAERWLRGNKMRIMSSGLILALCMSLIVVPVGAADYTIDIFGNANMDDSIDELDIEYVQGIIAGTNEETELADANHDGEIDEEDITQIELIISGEEEVLTVIDSAGRIVTVPQPIERIVTTQIPALRNVVILGAADNVVGIDSYSAENGMKFFCVQAHPELLDLPTVGNYDQLNMEAIIELNPDAIFSYSGYPDVADSIQGKTGIPVVCTLNVEPSNFYMTSGSFSESLMLTAEILDKRDRTEWLMSYVEDKLDRITKITAEIPEEEKPKVYALVWNGIRMTMDYAPVELAGGINVAKEYLLSQGLESAQINPEQVIIWNPDVIFLGCRGELVATLLEVHPGLEATNAVKEGNVYQIFGPMWCHDQIQLVVETYYMAKLLHPDEFHDFDVEDEANRMFEDVYGAEDLYNKVQEARGLELYRWE